MHRIEEISKRALNNKVITNMLKVILSTIAFLNNSIIVFDNVIHIATNSALNIDITITFPIIFSMVNANNVPKTRVAQNDERKVV